MKTIKQYPKAFNLAATVLKRGGVIVCPTDTVYGFLSKAENKKAVGEIYKIKKRTRLKPLPVFVRNIKMAKEIAEIDAKQEEILRRYWPGKYTFILKSKIKKEINSTVSGKKSKLKSQKLYGVGEDTIAIRVPNYKPLNNLLKKVNQPLAQTSVNISGEPPLTKIEDIKAHFAKNLRKSSVPLFLVDGGDLKKAKPSKIIDLTTDKKIIVRD